MTLDGRMELRRRVQEMISTSLVDDPARIAESWNLMSVNAQVVVTPLRTDHSVPRYEGGLEVVARQRAELRRGVRDLAFSLEHVHASSEGAVAARWEVRGMTTTGNTEVSLTASAIGRAPDGLIVAWREVWDSLNFFIAVGIVPTLDGYPGQLPATDRIDRITDGPGVA